MYFVFRNRLTNLDLVLTFAKEEVRIFAENATLLVEEISYILAQANFSKFIAIVLHMESLTILNKAVKWNDLQFIQITGIFRTLWHTIKQNK